MALRLSNSALNAGADALVDLIDAGSGDGGEIQFWSGPRPSGINDSPTGDILAVVVYEKPAFGNASSGVASALGTPLTTVGVSDGQIGFARVVNADGNILWDDDDVGTDASNSITVNTLTVSNGVDFEVTSHTFGVEDDVS